MAYENYNFVSWTDGSPLSSSRLGQMSINIEQVKDVVDDKAQGILKLNQLTSQLPNSTGYSDFEEYEIIALKDESGDLGPDRRVTIAENRYYKVSVNIPAITVKGRGAEDSRYMINLHEGFGLADTNRNRIGSWEVSPHPFGFYDVSGDVNANTITVKSNSYPTKIAAGLFSVVQATTVAITNRSFFVSINRITGANTVNAPRWVVEANAEAPLQFYVEDAGGL
jgi:hypothetical protein